MYLLLGRYFLNLRFQETGVGKCVEGYVNVMAGIDVA